MNRITDLINQLENKIKEKGYDPLVLKRVIESYVDDYCKESYTLDTQLTPVTCLLSKCSQRVYLTETEYKKKLTRCPHCKSEHYVRAYKNGSVNVTIK